MDFDAAINELSELSPVLHVPRAAVDLVDHDARGLAAPEQLQHVIEDGPSALGGRLALFEPLRDLQFVALGILLNRAALLLKRHAALALPRCGNANVSDVRFHLR